MGHPTFLLGERSGPNNIVLRFRQNCRLVDLFQHMDREPFFTRHSVRRRLCDAVAID
jgi:hypothetical protein